MFVAGARNSKHIGKPQRAVPDRRGLERLGSAIREVKTSVATTGRHGTRHGHS